MAVTFLCGLSVLLLVAVRPDDATQALCTDPADWKCKFLDLLEEAVRKGDSEAIRRVASSRDERGRTALHAASYFDLADAARLLLSSGADANAADQDGLTPLHVAVGPGPGSIEVAKVLVDGGADVGAGTGRPAEASATSCKPGDDWRCKFLDPLREAIEKDDQEALRRVASDVDEKGRTALHAASYFDLPDFVERLLSSGADVNARDEDGVTPLHVAAGHGTVAVAAALLDHGADFNAKTGRRSDHDSPSACEPEDWLCEVVPPLVVAAVEGGASAAARVLLEAVDERGRTALHVAAQYDLPGLARWLLERGFPVDTVDKRGRPASHVAAENDRPKILEILLAGGADAGFEPGKQKWERQQRKRALQKCA